MEVDVEETRGLVGKFGRKRSKNVLSLSDTLISIFLVTPLVVSFWRGTWELMAIYDAFLPREDLYMLGVTVHFVLAICRESLEEAMAKFKTAELVLRRCYSYLFAWSCVSFWLPNFALFDYVCSVEALSNSSSAQEGLFCFFVVFVIVITLTLFLLRSFRNVLSAPFAIVMDQKRSTYYFPTRFKKRMEEKTTLYVLDCLFSVLIVGTLVVFVWRGAWVLIDMYLFPDSMTWSSWASLILGYSIVAMAFLLQPLMRWICDRITGIPRIMVADVFLLFSFVGTVNVWRGIWNLLNLYFIPDDRELSSWITHWVCLVLLILLKCSNTLLVRGVYIDAEEHAGKCVVFPIYYLRLIFQHERAKKINKKFQLEAMARRRLEIENKSGCTCGMEIKNHITKDSIQNHCPEV